MEQTVLSLTASKPRAQHIYDLIDANMGEDIYALSFFEAEARAEQWTVSLYIDAASANIFIERLKVCLENENFDLDIQIETLPDQDWVDQSLQALTPVNAGRFVVFGDHLKNSHKSNKIGIEINAGQAFGTGHHGTTAGCLDMLEWVTKRTRPHTAFDIGTGSGVLAIGLARLCHIPILASDIDPISTQTAHYNARLNGVVNYVETITATGFNHNRFRQTGPVPLIIANILAGPLSRMAPEMEKYLEPGGHLILSGLLPYQRSRILSAYRIQGLYHLKSHVRDGWLTLVLQG